VSNGVKRIERKIKKALKSLENQGKSRLFFLAQREGFEPYESVYKSMGYRFLTKN
jgi:hypothetical protein